MTYTILYGHGSTDDQWVEEFEAVRAHVAAHVAPDSPVTSAFLQFVDPDLVTAAATAVAEGATRLIVVPVFLFSGRHLREDVPAHIAAVRQRFPGVEITAAEPIGRDPGFAAMVAARVERALTAA